jgi:formylglycine-generating enzyme required for sulfatase activity
MGRKDNLYKNSLQHEVNIPYDYWISRFPITESEYGRYLKAIGRTTKKSSEESGLYPVSGISWYAAQEYVHWLNKVYQRSIPENHMFCLPSEAEWEKAARGPDGRVFPWGNQEDEKRWGGYGKNFTPVGTFSPMGDSPYGVADLANKIYEWTRSKYEPYPYYSDDGREVDKASNKTFLVLRSGPYVYDRKTANPDATEELHYDAPYHYYDIFGLRVAVVPKRLR